MSVPAMNIQGMSSDVGSQGTGRSPKRPVTSDTRTTRALPNLCAAAPPSSAPTEPANKNAASAAAPRVKLPVRTTTSVGRNVRYAVSTADRRIETASSIERGTATARIEAIAVAAPSIRGSGRIQVEYARAKSTAATTAAISATDVACRPNVATRGTMMMAMIAVPVDPPVKKIAMPHSRRPPLACPACATACGWNAASPAAPARWRSEKQPPAVDDQGVPGDVIGLIRAKEEHRAHHVLRHAQTAHRNLGRRARHLFIGVEDTQGELGHDRAGRDGIHVDVVGGELRCDRRRQLPHAALADVIRGLGCG